MLNLYKMTGIRLQQQNETINQMIKQGIIEPGDSSTVSPVFFVSKKPSDGNDAVLGQLVYDYRNLNAKVKPLHFP